MTEEAPKRRQATQARSRATVERILDSAATLLAEKGAEHVTMTEIAQRADVVIGSLYQYFSQRSEILEALLERHYLDVETMLRTRLSGVHDLEGLADAVAEIFGGYAELHRRDTFVRNIWSAVQTDAKLQARDVADSIKNGDILFAVAKPLYRRVDDETLRATGALLAHLSLSAARFAIMIPEEMGEHAITVFQSFCRHAILSAAEPKVRKPRAPRPGPAPTAQ
jgi:AcrR family transcriptional regulator